MLKDQLGIFAGSPEHSLLDEDGNVNMEAMGADPTEAELEKGYSAPGTSALLPAGILYTANWKIYADGIAKHAREQVLALATTGLPVGLRSLGAQFVLTEELHEDVLDVAYLESIDFKSTYISIKHLILDTPALLKGIICPGSGTLSPEEVQQVYRSTIVYTSWERDVVAKELIDVLKEVGQVWVPCAANKVAFVESGLSVDKVRIVPYPFNPATCTMAAPRGPEKVPVGKRFYHIGKWEPRKNQHKILGAFLRAFTPKDQASLMLKTSPFGSPWANYPEPFTSVAFWLTDEKVKENGWDKQSLDRLVRIIAEKISEEQLQAIHEKNNIYVSAAAGEAWEIPAFDAKTTGNRLVYSGYGGAEEYAESEDVKVPYTLAPVHVGYSWEENAQWAEVQTDDLVLAMQQAQVPLRRVLPPNYVREFGRAAVGRLMRENIEDLATELGCWERLRDVGGFG